MGIPHPSRHPEPRSMNYSNVPSRLDCFNPEIFEINLEHFEVVSSIELIAVTVGALIDSTTI